MEFPAVPFVSVAPPAEPRGEKKTFFFKEGKSAINLSNLGNFCQIWPRAIYLC